MKKALLSAAVLALLLMCGGMARGQTADGEDCETVGVRVKSEE